MRALLVSFGDALGIKVLYCLSRSCEVVDVAASSARSSLRYSRYANRFLALPSNGSGFDADRAVEVINAHIESRGIDVILADNQDSMEFLYHNADRLAAPSFAPSKPETTARIHDKWCFYETLNAAGLNTPRTKILSSLDELSPSFADEIGFPLLIKPLNCEASHGIVTFQDYSTLESYVKSPGPYRELPLILQEFVPGIDIDYSAVKLDGRVLAYDVVEHAEFDVRLFRDEPRVVELGEAILKAFDYDGVAHIDMRIDQRTDKLFAIECNPRFWFTVTASLWKGTNFPALVAQAALGEKVPTATTEPGPYWLPSYVVRNFATPWRLTAVSRKNWSGFFQVVSDPLPHLMSKL
ncbi:MAG: ATP-grasp domain-containing protein [Pseudomonadota bacterium]